MIESGDIFLLDEGDDGSLIAHALTGGSDPLEDCSGMSAAAAAAIGATVQVSEIVDLPFGKVCRSEHRLPDSKLPARHLVWRLQDGLSVVVSCTPFEDGKPSGIACLAFAASVKAA